MNSPLKKNTEKTLKNFACAFARPTRKNTDFAANCPNYPHTP